MTDAVMTQPRPPRDGPTDEDQPAALELIDARAGYGRIEVLHGVDLAVWPGEVVALLGPNGAGKSTALGALSGRLELTGGHRHVLGRHVNSARSDELARIGISLVREGRSVYPNLSVADNLAVAASAGTTVSRMRQQAYDLFPRLSERRRQMAGTLSGGERQMLALACGLGADPAVLLIDELSMGLAPLIVSELYEVVAEVAGSGMSILLVEQFANLGLRVADRVCVMAQGSILYSGSPADAEAAIEAAYMGGGR